MHRMVTLIVAYLTREVLQIFFSVTAAFAVIEILYIYVTELSHSKQNAVGWAAGRASGL